MSGLVITVVLLAILVGVAAKIYLGREKEKKNAMAVPPYAAWTISHSQGATTNAIKGADGLFYFDLPKAPNSDNMITTVSPRPLKQGQRITLKFKIAGAGHAMPHEENTGPPRLRLFLWRYGDNLSGAGAAEFYRQWTKDVVIDHAGDYELSETLAPGNWTGVLGKNGNAQQFDDLLNNIALTGFSLGSSAAAHGCHAEGGDVRLTIVSHEIR